jgi:hypothetical protein
MSSVVEQVETEQTIKKIQAIEKISSHSSLAAMVPVRISCLLSRQVRKKAEPMIAIMDLGVA